MGASETPVGSSLWLSPSYTWVDAAETPAGSPLAETYKQNTGCWGASSTWGKGKKENLITILIVELALKENEIPSFAAMWTDLERVELNKPVTP